MADHQHDHPDDGGVHVHIHSWKLYAAILGALLTLTVATVAVSYVDVDGLLSMGNGVEGVGAWNLGIAVLIATVKAVLVVLFFMHLKDDARFNGLVFIGSLLFVGVFLAYTLNDTHFRGRVGDRYNGVAVDPETGLRAPGGIAGPIPGEVLERGLTAPAAPAAEEAAPEAAAMPVPEEGDETVEDIAADLAGEDEPVADDAEGDPEADLAALDAEAAAADDELPAEEPPAEEAPAEEAPAPAPAPAAVVRRPRPARPAPEAPSQPEPEPEPEAAE